MAVGDGNTRTIAPTWETVVDGQPLRRCFQRCLVNKLPVLSIRTLRIKDISIQGGGGAGRSDRRYAQQAIAYAQFPFVRIIAAHDAVTLTERNPIRSRHGEDTSGNVEILDADVPNNCAHFHKQQGEGVMRGIIRCAECGTYIPRILLGLEGVTSRSHFSGPPI